MPSRILRFICNGMVATAVHAAIVFILTQHYAIGVGIANAIAFLIATAVSYVSNTLWTFESRHTARIMFRYVAVTCVGSVASYLLASLCAALGMPWWGGVALIVMVMPVFTWKAHRLWTYAG